MTKTWFGSWVPHCWLPIKSHISYKLLLLTSKCLHALAPSLMALEWPAHYSSPFLASKEVWAFYCHSHPLKLSVDFIIATCIIFLFVIYYCRNIIIKIISTAARKNRLFCDKLVFGTHFFFIYLLVCLSLKFLSYRLIMKCCFIIMLL